MRCPSPNRPGRAALWQRSQLLSVALLLIDSLSLWPLAAPCTVLSVGQTLYQVLPMSHLMALYDDSEIQRTADILPRK